MIELLANTGYIVVNKKLIKLIGIHEALLLGELCSEYIYWKKENRLDEEGYFFSTRENIEENTGLSSYQQRGAIKSLISKGLIKEISKGMPQRNYYKLNQDNINKLITEEDNKETILSNEEASSPVVKKLNNKELNNLTTSSEETEHQEVKKLNTNNNKIIIINKNNNQSILSEAEIERGKIEDLVKNNIEYNILITDKYIENEVKDIINIVIDILTSNKEAIMIAGELKPIQIVKAMMLKLKSYHIQHVVYKLKENTVDIRNIKVYITTMLYNALQTTHIDTTAKASKFINGGYINE